MSLNQPGKTIDDLWATVYEVAETKGPTDMDYDVDVPAVCEVSKGRDGSAPRDGNLAHFHAEPTVVVIDGGTRQPAGTSSTAATYREAAKP